MTIIEAKVSDSKKLYDSVLAGNFDYFWLYDKKNKPLLDNAIKYCCSKKRKAEIPFFKVGKKLYVCFTPDPNIYHTDSCAGLYANDCLIHFYGLTPIIPEVKYWTGKTTVIFSKKNKDVPKLHYLPSKKAF